MILDYNPERKLWFLRVPRFEADPEQIMREYGLLFSTPASTPKEAVLFTNQPYAAAAFAHVATDEARLPLSSMIDEIALSRALDDAGHYDVPDGMELYGYQRADLAYMLRRTHSLDADEPGLGKTPTAIVYCNELRAKRVLVVCPAGIRFQWCQRIVQWSTMGRYLPVGASRVVYAVTSAKYGVRDDAAWTVISYDLANRKGIYEALMKQSFDVLILDEAHYVKSAGAGRTRKIFGSFREPGGLASRAGSVIALTGTPLPNRPREIYPIARHLSWESIDWLSEDAFGERFNPIDYREVTKKDGTVVRLTDEESGRHAELQNRLRAHFMCRHLEHETGFQRPKVTYDLVYAEETGPVRAALAAERMLDIDPDNLEGATADILGHIAEARRLMGEALAPQAAAYAKEIVHGGTSKLFIFYWHITVGNILEQELRSLGVVRVDGSTGAASRESRIKRFIDDPEIQVIIGNAVSLGTGVDGLQHVCAHAIAAEPDWTPANNIQPIKRLDRNGQLRSVFADFFVARDSIAEKVLAASLRKTRVTHNALDRRVA